MNPGMILVQRLRGIDDPRVTGRCDHALVNILVIALREHGQRGLGSCQVVFSGIQVFLMRGFGNVSMRDSQATTT